ncbi:MAG: hypothetical protein AAGA84_04795 [Pseudomonadota bacterium]
MASGRHLLAELDRALNTSRDEFRALDIELQSASAALARNQRRQISLYQKLAQHRLAEIDSERFTSSADAADKQAQRLLQERSSALSALHQQIADSESRIDALDAVEKNAQQELDDAEVSLNTLLLEVDEALVQDGAFQALRQDAQTALDTAANAAAKTTEAQARREDKRIPYDSDPLFSYLWREGYGTPDYRAGLLQRFMDGLIAKHIRFESARRNYFTLNEIPRRLEQHAARLEETAASKTQAVLDAETEADNAAGAQQLQQAVDAAQTTLREASDTADSEQERCADLIRKRESFALGQDEHFVKAMKILSDQFRAEPIPQLRQDAAMTPAYEDDEVVDEIESLRREQQRLSHYLEGHRDLHTRRAARVNELTAVRRRYKQRDYDSSNSVIDDHGKVSLMLSEFLRGVISSDRLWRSIRHSQRFRKSRMPHHRKQRVGVSIPRMPRSVRVPRSRGGGGFRTKGGF